MPLHEDDEISDKAKINVGRDFDIEVEHLQGKKYKITPDPSRIRLVLGRYVRY